MHIGIIFIIKRIKIQTKTQIQLSIYVSYRSEVWLEVGKNPGLSWRIPIISLFQEAQS